MQIVIDINDEIYKEILSGKDGLSNYVHGLIRIGTPLPQGHGRLIDADDIALIDEQFYVPSDYYVAESAINDAPTIVEADTESEE
jgi:hypothetical protein